MSALHAARPCVRLASAVLLGAALLLAGCAATAPVQAPGPQPQPQHAPGSPYAAEREGLVVDAHAAALPLPPDPSPLDTYDPWERFNRGVYRFNARFDEAVFLPVATAWKRVLPRPVRGGIANVFANLGEVGNLANYALQGRFAYSGRSLARLLLNTTLGLGGVFDVAAHAGVERAPTSFGTTLARWGVGAGPYVVVPLLGPSSLRDGFGFLADFGITRGVDLGGVYSSDDSFLLGVTNAVDTRSRLDFRYYASGSPFEYENLRFLYTRKRMLEALAPHAPDPAQPPEEAQAR